MPTIKRTRARRYPLLLRADHEDAGPYYLVDLAGYGVSWRQPAKQLVPVPNPYPARYAGASHRVETTWVPTFRKALLAFELADMFPELSAKDAKRISDGAWKRFERSGGHPADVERYAFAMAREEVPASSRDRARGARRDPSSDNRVGTRAEANRLARAGATWYDTSFFGSKERELVADPEPGDDDESGLSRLWVVERNGEIIITPKGQAVLRRLSSGSVGRDVGFSRAELHRRIDEGNLAKVRARERAARAELADMRRQRDEALAASRASCRARRVVLRQGCREEQSNLRDQVRWASALAAGTFREQRRALADTRMVLPRPPRRRGAAAERRAESDDEVRANIPRDLHSYFERVKRSIKGSPRMSRTEAFLQLVHDEGNEGHDWQSLEDASDRALREMLEKHGQVPVPRSRRRAG